jgi:hypothetical protein
MGWDKDIHVAVYDGEDPIAVFSYTEETKFIYLEKPLIIKENHSFRLLTTAEYDTFLAFELVPIVSPVEYSQP